MFPLEVMCEVNEVPPSFSILTLSVAFVVKAKSSFELTWIFKTSPLASPNIPPSILFNVHLCRYLSSSVFCKCSNASGAIALPPFPIPTNPENLPSENEPVPVAIISPLELMFPLEVIWLSINTINLKYTFPKV